jgi:hypothetical protein
VIRAIANKRLDLTDEEYDVYNQIVSVVDKSEFNNVFITDNNGRIKAIFPPIDQQISMVVVYFLFNIMINQRVRKIDYLIDDMEALKAKINKMEGA